MEATTYAPAPETAEDTPQFTPAILAGLELEVLAVGRVIDAIRENTYGQCEFCSAEIPHDDIRQNPLTFYCRDHRNVG